MLALNHLLFMARINHPQRRLPIRWGLPLLVSMLTGALRMYTEKPCATSEPAYTLHPVAKQEGVAPATATVNTINCDLGRLKNSSLR